MKKKLIKLKNHILTRTGRKPILIDAFYSDKNSNQCIIIFCHGYKGFKDWGAWNIMAKKLAESGSCFIKFNFSHNGGTMENPIDFPDLESFGKNNYIKELDDLKDVINWSQEYFKKNPLINEENLCLLGHSRGGGICILKAAQDQRIKKLITLASVCEFDTRTTAISDLNLWRKKGVAFVLNARTKQQMPHYYQFYENFIAHKDTLNIKKATKMLNIPVLIIHGDNDTSVNMQEAKKLHKWYPRSTLKIIEGANHVFNTKHPWIDSTIPSIFSSVIRIISKF